MQWRRRFSPRLPRPKVQRLSADTQEEILATITWEIADSPILSGFGLQVRFLRGRFYVERPLPSGNVVWWPDHAGIRHRVEVCPDQDSRLFRPAEADIASFADPFAGEEHPHQFVGDQAFGPLIFRAAVFLGK